MSGRPLERATEATLRRLVDQAQRDWRAPTVSAAVVRNGVRVLDHLAGVRSPAKETAQLGAATARALVV